MANIKASKKNSKLLEEYSAQGFYRNETLSSWLEHNASEFADNPAIISSSYSLSYSELSHRVSTLAAGLQSLNLGKGDIIAVQLPNIPEYVISYLAIASIGGIMQTLHMPYRQSELQYLLNDSEASTVICLSKTKTLSPASIMLDLVKSTTTLRHIISVGEKVNGTVDFDELRSEALNFAKPDLSTDDPYVLLYTSGTTSLPKGVPHRYKNFLTNARLCCEEYSFTDKDSLLSLAPLTHLYGLFSYNLSLSCAASSILLPAFTPDDFVTLVKQQKPTAIFAAPAHFMGSFGSGKLKQEDFESVEFVCLSGSNVPSELARKVDALLINGKVG